jgi:glycosyltransferase involved in cell wall biosynthesis
MHEMQVENNNKYFPMKRKVVIIQPSLAPYRIPLFAKIAASGFMDVTVVVMAPNLRQYPTWKFDFNRLPFRAVLVPGFTFMLPSKLTRAQVSVNPNLVGFLCRERPDVIFCSGFIISTLFACAYRVFKNTRIVIWNEGHQISEGQRQLRSLRRGIRRLISALASGFVVAGRASQEYVNSLLPRNIKKPIVVSYNCVDGEALVLACKNFKSDLATWAPFRNRYPNKVILFSGRLVELKGIRLLLQVYERVLESSPSEVGLILLGEGELREEIQREKERRGLHHLYLEGFIGPEEYPKFFAAADLFLFLSLHDCNPLVISEALSCRLPIICSNLVGNAVDFVEEGRNGHVVDPFDIEGVAEKVLSVLYSPRIEEMRNASQDIGRKANYQDSAEAFVRIAEQLVSRRGV